jgi:hypothetical protein
VTSCFSSSEACIVGKKSKSANEEVIRRQPIRGRAPSDQSQNSADFEPFCPGDLSQRLVERQEAMEAGLVLVSDHGRRQLTNVGRPQRVNEDDPFGGFDRLVTPAIRFAERRKESISVPRVSASSSVRSGRGFFWRSPT